MSRSGTDDHDSETSAPTEAGAAHEPYVVVARRYRPQTFDQLIGQQLVARALRNAIKTSRVGHAYLFTGARGVGKTSTARILAKALNCVAGPTTEPCDECDICQRVARGEDVDVLEIDGASNRGIDEIRQLRTNANVRPSRARFKIYIIDEVHMLTREAFNALLKTLEEPPDHVKFVFCTTDPEKIPVTVLSRCQRYDFAPVDTASIETRLQQIVEAEGASAEPAALGLLARRAAGSLRDSQSLLEQLLAFAGAQITVESVHHMLGTARSGRLEAIVRCLIDRDAAGALTELDSAVDEGVDVGQLTEQLLGFLRDMMVVAVGGGADLLLYGTATDYTHLADAAERWGVETVLAAVQILDQAVARMRQSVHVRTLAELAMVQIAKLEDLDAMTDLVAQLKSGTPMAAGPASSRRPPSPDTGRRSQSDVATAKKKTMAVHDPGVGIRVSAASSSPAATSGPGGGGELGRESCWGDTSQEEALALWRQALDDLNDMTADCGRRFASVAISAPNRLVVYFGAKYNSSKLYCERPEPRDRLESALAKVSGKSIRIEFRLSEETPFVEKAAEPVVSVRQRTREVYSHPMVQQAVTLFGAEVTNVDLRPPDNP